ncbi:MAG: type II toxin-antitoxin system RelE/ParE family toxin [Clostridiales bacterium]|nr:type II toxin-antitoxin system RelE/ParE family toxin [Clostridiales bacterium]
MHRTGFILRYLPLFKEELYHEVSYIAFKLGDLDAANRLLDKVGTAILKRLDDGPDIFEEVSTRKKRNYPYYRIYVSNYIVYYVVMEESGDKIMEVRRFLHAREDRENKL